MSISWIDAAIDPGFYSLTESGSAVVRDDTAAQSGHGQFDERNSWFWVNVLTLIESVWSNILDGRFNTKSFQLLDVWHVLGEDPAVMLGYTHVLVLCIIRGIVSLYKE